MHKTSLDRASALSGGLYAVRPIVLVAVVFSMFINVLMLVSPLYMLQIYDRVLTSRSAPTLIAITGIAGFLLVVYAMLEALRSRVLVRAGLIFDKELALAVFGAAHRTTLRTPGAIPQQSLSDVGVLRQFLTGAGLIAFCDAPWFPIFAIASFMLHPWFGFLAILGGATIWALTLANELLTSGDLTRATAARITAGQRAASAFRNGEVLHAMGMLDGLRSRWIGPHREYLNWQARASDRAGTMVAATKFFRLFLQIIILGTGGYLAIQKAISPGAIVAASILVSRALQPMEIAIANWKNFIAARGAYSRLKALFESAGGEPARMPLSRPAGLLSVDNIIVAAPGHHDAILHGVSFALSPGQTMSVIGPSAAGKSTLARVLVGIWPARHGSVRLDGSELSHWDPRQLGQFIGYLPQDVELFAGTISDNIGRFEETIYPDMVIRAAQRAGCHEMIKQLPEGYNTEIGEGGRALSGGQRQLIALARALYGDPSLVVLDEPNANLDIACEEALLGAIQGLKVRHKTVILITHKMNMLAVADAILVMSRGVVEAFGPRDEILSRQFGPRIVAPATAQVHQTTTGATR